jgi:TrmH family RNA methyltransferase
MYWLPDFFCAGITASFSGLQIKKKTGMMKVSNNKIKELKALHSVKFRQKYQKFIAEGTKIAEEVLRADHCSPLEIYALPNWLETQQPRLSRMPACDIYEVTPQELGRISTLTTPNQVLMVLPIHPPPLLVQEVSRDLCLYLDDIRDPGNLGSILRIADWFGIPWVFCSESSVELFNPKVVQASMGAFLRVRCLTVEFETLCKALPDMPVYAAMPDGSPVFGVSLATPAIIAIGNESRGVSSTVLDCADVSISIPRGPGGAAESLNAAIATGIICAAFRNSARPATSQGNPV